MANEIFMRKIMQCVNNLDTMHDIISSSEENKEKYKKIRIFVGIIIVSLIQKKEQEDIKELCDQLKDEAIEYNDSGDNLKIKTSASDFATKIAMIKQSQYGEFLEAMIKEDEKKSIEFFISSEPFNESKQKSEITIEKIEFGDRDNDGNTHRNFGEKLYTDVEYLKPKVTYEVINVGDKIELWYKIYSPSGKLLSGKNAKEGFTWRGYLLCESKGKCTAIIGGFGGEDKTTYAESGTWRIEFYRDDEMLYKTTFEIHPLPPAFTFNPSPQPQPKPQPKPQPQPKSSFLDKLNNGVQWIGDILGDAGGVIIAIAAIYVIIAIIGLVVTWINDGFWEALAFSLIAIVVGGISWVVIVILNLIKIFDLLAWLFRDVIFVNIWTLLISIILIAGGAWGIPALVQSHDTSNKNKTTQVQPATVTYYCTAKSLNVRSVPSTSGKVVGKLKYGQAVEVLQEGAAFCKIKFTHSSGETAWVGSQYISKTKPVTTTTNTTKKTSNTSSKATTTTTSKSKTSSNSTTSTTKATTSNSTSTSKLLVDSKTYLIYKLSSNSGQRIFSVSTSESDYQIISKPAWCSILKKEKGYFEIKYEANSQKVERSGTIKLKAGDATASIALVQRVGTDNTTSQTTSSSSASKTSASSSQSTAPAKGMHNGYEYVDLGLSVKWATNNMDGHYRFGEKNPRPTRVGNTDSYRGSTYSLSNDVARANWGGNWRLPTKSEFEELINKCKWTATTQGGVRGLKVTGPTGNSIFLPAAGYRHESTNNLMSRNEVGYYWSSTSYGGGRVWTLNIWCGGSSSQKMAGAYGSFGNCIRPVCR